MQRAGAERPGVGRLQAGDVIAVTPLEADALARNGAGDAITSAQAAALPPAEAVIHPRSQQARTPRGPAPQASTQPTRLPLHQTAAEGEVLVQMRRSGVERPGVGQLLPGDVVAVTPNEAIALARNGAADLVGGEAAGELGLGHPDKAGAAQTPEKETAAADGVNAATPA